MIVKRAIGAKYSRVLKGRCLALVWMSRSHRAGTSGVRVWSAYKAIPSSGPACLPQLIYDSKGLDDDTEF